MVRFLYLPSLCLLVEQIEAICAALIGKDLLPLYPTLADVLCNLMGALLEKGKA